MSNYTRIMSLLSDGKWHTAQEIRITTGIDPRTMRQIAEETGDFIGGNEGYKRADLATQEELDHAIAALKSRAIKILKRTHRLELLASNPYPQMNFDLKII